MPGMYEKVGELWNILPHARALGRAARPKVTALNDTFMLSVGSLVALREYDAAKRGVVRVHDITSK